MDYRYETNHEARDFHKKRVAFIILNDKGYYIKNSGMSHWEYCETLGIPKEQFNELTRGYYLAGDIVFYKGNFIYDDSLINEALNYLLEIKKECNASKMNIYFGQIVPKQNEAWKYDYCYGYIDEKNNIVKSENLNKFTKH